MPNDVTEHEAGPDALGLRREDTQVDGADPELEELEEAETPAEPAKPKGK